MNKKSGIEIARSYIVGTQIMDMDKLTKRLWEELEKELKEFYEFLDEVAPPPKEEPETKKKGDNLWKP